MSSAWAEPRARGGDEAPQAAAAPRQGASETPGAERSPGRAAFWNQRPEGGAPRGALGGAGSDAGRPLSGLFRWSPGKR